MTGSSHALPNITPDEDWSVALFFKSFLAQFCHSKGGPEGELIFKRYYYHILIRHARITFGLVSVIYVATGFLFLSPPQPGLFAGHLVFAIVSMGSLGASFLPFFRVVWKLYVFIFACAAMVLAYFGSATFPKVVEVSVLILITMCLMSGLPLGLTFLLAIVNMIIFEVFSVRTGADTLAMIRSNAFFTFFVGFLLYATHTRVRGIRTQFETLETVKVQRKKSDSIIQHMLPPFVVQKLKAKHDSVIVDHFDSVTVMFCEIVNFNALLEKMPAQEVVQLLNDIYTAFDRLTDVHGVNKVEHIGNVYVVSAGCPEVTPYHSGRVAEMALKMLSVVRNFRRVELRIGIHTGAVMAGVIGFKKLSYHLFGDTINTASRMCSHGAIQRIHVSEATYQLLSTKYVFESRGEIGVKGKGVMRTYFLDSRKTHMHTSGFSPSASHNHVPSHNMGTFTAERAGFGSPMHGFPPIQLPPNAFRPSGPIGPGALASEFSHNTGTKTHRSGYVAARPSTGSMRMSEQGAKDRIPLRKRILSFFGTPDHTPIEILETEQEGSKVRYKKNIFTLRFTGNPDIETEFRIRNAHVHHTRMCCAMLFSLVGLAFCGLYDYYWAEGPKAQYYAFRYVFCFFGFVCIGLAVRFREYVEFISLGVLASTQAVTLIIEVWAHGNAPLSLTAVVLTMFITSMTFNVSCVRFFFCFIVHITGFVLFEFLQLLQPTTAIDMTVHSSFVVFALVMNIISCYMQERYERDNWVHELVLDDEIDKTDALLTGLLPVSVLVELKEGRQLIADEFEQVTVMLSDIVGFTEIASRITPAQLVEMLNVLFSVFDRLAEKYGVLKIATIGDAYLCIAGCPEKSEDHAQRIASMALEMIESVKAIIAPDGTQVRVRIGVHTGPIIAGVVGIKMIHYQIWGDTVQIAQKMESSGKASHVHISKATHSLLEKHYKFEPADVVKIKNKDMDTFFLTGRRSSHTQVVATKQRGFSTVGPNTPRIIDLSSSMIFQNAGSWTMKKPSSPNSNSLNSSQRMLSAKRYPPRTPRRGDMLTPLPTHRVRKMSMLSPGGRDALELGESQETPPSLILDNILGRNSFNDEISPLDRDEFNYDDDLISNDNFSTLGSAASHSDVAEYMRRDHEDDLIDPVSNFSFNNGLRLTSLVVPQHVPVVRLPPSPSGSFLVIAQPFPPQIPPPPIVRDVRSPPTNSRSNDVPGRSRSDSLTRTHEPPVRVRSDSLTRADGQPRTRSNSLTVTCEPGRMRSNSLTRSGEPAFRTHNSDSLSRASSYMSDSSYASEILASAVSFDAPAQLQEPQPTKSPHLILQVNLPPPTAPFPQNSPLCKDALRIPLHEIVDLPSHSPGVV